MSTDKILKDLIEDTKFEANLLEEVPITRSRFCDNVGLELYNALREKFRETTLEDLQNMDNEDLVQLKNIITKDDVLWLELIKPSWNTLVIPDCHLEPYKNLQDQVNGEYDILTNVVYRSFAKSAIKKNVTLIDILERRELVIVYVNETIKQSRADLDAVKYEIRTNEIIRFLYGECTSATMDDGTRLKRWNADSTTFYLNEDPTKWVYLEATGMTSAIRGINYNSIRITKVWMDDFESEGNSSSSDGREKVRDKIRKQILPAGQPGNFRVVFQGTIVHPKAWLAEIKEDWKDTNTTGPFKNGNCRYFERSMSTCPDTYGVGTWPENHSKTFWQEKRSMYTKEGEMWKFYQEFYNTPKQASAPSFNVDAIMPNDAVFKHEEGINYLDYGDRKLPIRTFIGIDPAYAKTARADDTVLTVIGMLPSGYAIVLDMFVGKVDLREKVKLLFDYAGKYKPSVIHIEAFGAAMELPEYFVQEMKLRNERYRLQVFKEKVGKSSKFLDGLSPYINSGKIGYLSKCPNIELMKFQMQSFSGEERYHDDTIDGLYLAFVVASPPKMCDIDVEIAKALSKKKVSYDPYAQISKMQKQTENRSIRRWRI